MRKKPTRSSPMDNVYKGLLKTHKPYHIRDKDSVDPLDFLKAVVGGNPIEQFHKSQQDVGANIDGEAGYERGFVYPSINKRIDCAKAIIPYIHAKISEGKDLTNEEILNAMKDEIFNNVDRIN